MRAHVSQDSDSERPTKKTSKWRKHSILILLSRERDCEVCKRSKITKAPYRRRTDEAVPRTEKIEDLITADRKVLNEECKYSIRCRETRSCHWMDSVLSVWNQNFARDEKVLTEISRAIRKTKGHLHWQFFGICKILRRLILESSDVINSSVRDERHYWTSSTKSERRNI